MDESVTAPVRRHSCVLCVGLLVLAGASCATFRSYQFELNRTMDLAAIGELGEAIEVHESFNRKSKDLVYYLERGELLRLAGRYQESQQAWLEADRQVAERENVERLSTDMLLRDAGSLLVNDRTRAYPGQDFEKVMMTTRMALNDLALGQWDRARVAVKRTHEREALIAELRSEQVRRSEEKAEDKGHVRDFRELNGYPVQTIDSPEVNALRNSYQSAFSHYLAGFVYEALGERGLAAAGYRQAIELRPDTELLEDGLSGLDARFSQRDNEGADLLIVVETGAAPARSSVSVNIPVPTDEGVMLAPVSFPALRQQNSPDGAYGVTIDSGHRAEMVRVTSVDLMARRALQDEMPWILLRAVARATAKVSVQREAAKKDDSNVRAAAIFGTVVTEQADERSWRSLPAEIAIFRARVEAGKHDVVFDVGNQRHRFTIALDGSFALMSVRLLGGEAYVSAPTSARGSATAGRFDSRPVTTNGQRRSHEPS